MSSVGWQRAQLEARRKEQLRLEQLRSQCAGLVTACRDRMLSVIQPAVQQLAAPGLKEVQRDLEAASQMIDASPKEAIGQIKKAQKALNRTIAQAQAKALKWSRLQARSAAALQEVAQEAQAQKDSSTKSGDDVLAKVDEGIAQADSLHNAGRYEEAMADLAADGQEFDDPAFLVIARQIGEMRHALQLGSVGHPVARGPRTLRYDGR